jgi:hypothetical protein
MKTIIQVLAVLILIFAPIISLAQITNFQDDIFKNELPVDIPNKATTIKVTGISFIEACGVLLDAGYEIAKKDMDMFTAETKSVDYTCLFGPCNTDIIYLRKKGDTLHITSKCKIGTAGWHLGYYEEKKGKPKKDVQVMAFLNAYVVAAKMSDNLTFE